MVLVHGMFYHFGLSVGAWSIIIGLVIIALTAILLKRLPRIGTFMNMIFCGVFLDFFNSILPAAHTPLTQFGCFVLGIVGIAVGCGVYVSTNLGEGPRDSLMMIAVEKLHVSITVARTAMEIFAAGLGYIMGGPVGIGTIIMVFALGPIIQVVLPVSRRILAHFIKEPTLMYK